jgi:hypothetical protein
VITLGISAHGAVRSAEPLAGAGRSSAQIWAIRKDRVKLSQNFQCLFCGRNEGRYKKLEIHHIEKREHGGGNAWSNTLALCPACHHVIHNIADRGIPLAGRIILALQLIGSQESRVVALISRLLFRTFLCSSAANAFHPARLGPRPLRAAVLNAVGQGEAA